LTDVPQEEIAALRSRVASGAVNPRDVKAALARTITSQFHGEEAAARAEEDFRRAFSKGEIPEEVETRELPRSEATAARALVSLGLSSSMREARRKIAEGALQIYPAGAAAPRAARDPEESLASPDPIVLRLGRRFVRVSWKGE
jgi:tyrosyl-tRNA synthetase